MPVRSPLIFYPAYLWEIVAKYSRLLALAWRFRRVRARVERDRSKAHYTDVAIEPETDGKSEPLPTLDRTRSVAASPAAAEVGLGATAHSR
jgi:hypothetical protein